MAGGERESTHPLLYALLSAKSRGGGRLLSWSKTGFNANLAPSIFKDLTC
jgi:hypothetical protein